MIRYLVKETAVATEANPRFAGQRIMAWTGKGDHLVKYVGVDEAFDRTKYMIEEYGYKRMCDAKRNYTYNHPEKSKFWESTVEIVEVRI